MPDHPSSADEPTVAGLILARIDASEKATNQRLDQTAELLRQRLDYQDDKLNKIEAQTTKTNGRVTALELARTRAQGALAAYRWIPALLTILLTTGTTILVLAVTGGLH